MDAIRADAVRGGIHGARCLLDLVQSLWCQVTENRAGEERKRIVPSLESLIGNKKLEERESAGAGCHSCLLFFHFFHFFHFLLFKM